jgi:hypothetical protein
VPVDELVAFALDSWPGARLLPEWQALDRRRSVGARRAARHPRFVVAALHRRVQDERWRMRWLRTGELG